MNLHFPIIEQSAAIELAPPSAFVRAPQRARRSRVHAIGLAGAILVHALAAVLYFNVHTTFAVLKERPVTMIDIPPEMPKPVELPPSPKFEPPQVYVPAPIIPLIVLDDPPPAPTAITLPPPSPSPTPPTAPLAQGPTVPFDGDARAAYIGALLKHLNRFKQYPQSAKLRHEQGVVSLRFRIDRNGRVLTASITKGSGSAALDNEVLAAVKRADPFPRIPDILGRDQLDLVVPVEFVLR